MSAYTKKKPMKSVLLSKPVLAQKKGKIPVNTTRKGKRLESSKPDDVKPS